MRLAINIDHVATLREARGGIEPDPVAAAILCELAGAEGIVCHLREDRRHINDRDLRLLRECVKTRLDLEMAATEEIVRIAIETVPELATLVPERREELTTEGGLDVRNHRHVLKEVVKDLHRHDIEVSMFVDPAPEQIEASHDIGADKIEIHTGEFANARTEEELAGRLGLIREAAELGKQMGMGVNAGHGLHYLNIAHILSIPQIDEVSIGHAILARSILVGLDRAVREMLALVRR